VSLAVQKIKYVRVSQNGQLLRKLILFREIIDDNRLVVMGTNARYVMA
jgi:hypothetical protein